MAEKKYREFDVIVRYALPGGTDFYTTIARMTVTVRRRLTCSEAVQHLTQAVADSDNGGGFIGIGSHIFATIAIMHLEVEGVEG